MCNNPSTPPGDSTANRESFLADLGELAGPLTHEFTNVLNTLSLQLALLQQVGPADLESNLQTIRSQIANAVGVIKRFQHYRHRNLLEPTLLDLNAAMRHVVDEMPASPLQAPVVLQLDLKLPKVRGFEADALRLCRFLLANAVRAVPAQGPAVIARTAWSEGKVLLQVEDGGPSVPARSLLAIFEPGHEQREGMCCLELAACSSIVRRMNGRLQAHARPGGGLILSVALPKGD